MKTTLEFRSDRAELLKLEPFTSEFASQAGLSAADLFALQIVVEELVTNVIDYGGVPSGEPAGSVELAVADGELCVVITDRAQPYNPLERAEPDTTLPAELRPIGGLGVHFCKKLTDTQTYERSGDKNVLRLRRKLTS